MNRIKNLLIFFSFLISFSCNNSEKIKIGYLVPNLNGERYKKEQMMFSKKIQELGGEALLASADYDDKLQIQQAHEMIEKGVKVIVVNSVNMNTAAAIVRDAHENNVAVIAYDRLIRNCDLDYYVSFDNMKVGKLMAESLLKLKPEGNYILLGGDKADLNAVLVKNGQMDILSKYVNEGKIKINYDIFVEDWAAENAYHNLKQYINLSSVTPDAILSSYDGISAGCLKALDELNVSGVLLTGQDAELEACRNIVRDRQTMTVYKPLKTLVEKAAEISFKLASGQNFEKSTATINNNFTDVPSYLLDPIAVDKNNIKNTIISDGFYTESQIFD